MPIAGKFFLGTVGVVFGGPIGGLLGATLGHFLFDTGLMERAPEPPRRSPRREAPRRSPGASADDQADRVMESSAAQTRFVVNLIALAMGLAKSDGELHQMEVRRIKELFERQWNYPPDDLRVVQEIMKRFQSGLAPEQIPAVCAEFRRVSTAEERRLMVHLLFSVALADGAFQPAEAGYLDSVARWLEMGPAEYAHIKGQYVDDRDRYYKVLGVPPGADAEAIKRAYRKLALEYHPDKVSHLGAELQEFAHRKFIEIKTAYEKLTERR